MYLFHLYFTSIIIIIITINVIAARPPGFAAD